MLTRACCKYFSKIISNRSSQLLSRPKNVAQKRSRHQRGALFFTSTCHCQSVSLPRNQESGTWRTWRDPVAKTTWQLLQDYERWFVVRQNISVDAIVLTSFVTRFFRLWRLLTVHYTSTKKDQKTLLCRFNTVLCTKIYSSNTIRLSFQKSKNPAGRHDKSY